jgi:hypothetical protein
MGTLSNGEVISKLQRFLAADIVCPPLHENLKSLAISELFMLEATCICQN